MNRTHDIFTYTSVILKSRDKVFTFYDAICYLTFVVEVKYLTLNVFFSSVYPLDPQRVDPYHP